MPNLTREQKKETIEAAFNHVHTDVENLIKQAASEHAIANMGQVLEDFFPYGQPNLEKFFSQCFSIFYQQSESDEMAEGLEAERKEWMKDAKRDVAAVQKKGLPLTMRNVRDAFEFKGPFAKKKKK